MNIGNEIRKLALDNCVTITRLAQCIAERKGKPKAELGGCSACPMAKNCALIAKGEACEEKKEGNAV